MKTDKSDDPTAVIQNWMRNREVMDFWRLYKGDER